MEDSPEEFHGRTALEVLLLACAAAAVYSPDGRRIAASVAENGRWRVVVADRNGRIMRRVDPEDGANRYDAASGATRNFRRNSCVIRSSVLQCALINYGYPIKKDPNCNGFS